MTFLASARIIPIITNIVAEFDILHHLVLALNPNAYHIESKLVEAIITANILFLPTPINPKILYTILLSNFHRSIA